MKNFLKRLELQGFKSFAGKTILEFPARVVAIVGPNGSGKSNIIDAFRWVLGERETKQLRGGTLQNLIFAGTPKKAAVGLAKVSLCFDNHGGEFPLDAKEIMVVRRVDRTGVSQFFLNNEEIRLKDLVPFLARAKLGSRGLTMVGQGQSDIFVESSPEERRMMIEEILGLKEFRMKKNQAERRLVSSEINMDKVRAMLEELLPHLRLLRRQKHRWDKRSEIEKDLIEIEDKYYSFAYQLSNKGLARMREPILELRREQEEKRKEADVLEKKIESANKKSSHIDELKDIRMKVTDFFRRRSLVERELARIDVKIEMQAKELQPKVRDINIFEETVRSVAHDIEEVLKWHDTESIKSALRKWLGKFNSLFSEKKIDANENLLIEKKKYENELKIIDEEISAQREKEELYVKDQEIENQEFRRQITLLEKKKNEVMEIDRKLQTYALETEKLNLKIGELEREWRSLGRALDELKSLPPTETIEDPPAMERKMMKLRGELAAIGDVDENLVKEAEDTEERHKFLTRELHDLETACSDLRKLIKDLEVRIHNDFKETFRSINDEFNNYFRLMFGGGRARLKIEKKRIADAKTTGTESENGEVVPNEEFEKSDGRNAESDIAAGVEIELALPKKKITSLNMLSGGERTLVSIAALFALISVSPPPFLVLDEIDASLDESNAQRFAELIKEFSSKTQFVIVTHNRATMEVADVLYGITMADDGVSKILSIKLD